MGFVNLPPNLQVIFSDLDSRLCKLENAQRFTMPNTPVLTTQPTITGLASGDPSNPRTGDIWLNTTSNTPKYVNSLGAVTSLVSSGGGSPFGPRYIKTGYAYGTIVPATLTSSTLPSNNTMYATPIYIPASATATSIGIYVNTLAGATSMGIRTGLYTNSSTDDYPNTLVSGSDSFVETSTTFGATGWNFNVVSLSLTAGLYWLVSVRQATSAPTTLCVTSGLSGDSPIPAVTIAGGNNSPSIAYLQTGVTGALPSTFTATKTTQAGSVHQVVLGF
jgi:hypothetical protein